MRTFFSNNGPRDRRGQAHAAMETWKEVVAWNPKSWQLPKKGFCEDCKKKVMVKLDDGDQTCEECKGHNVRKLSKEKRTG